MTAVRIPITYWDHIGGTNNRAKFKKSFVKKPRSNEEHILQCSIINTAHALNPRIVLRAVPNGGARNIRVAMKLKREGVKKGTYDLFCFIPTRGVGWLEVKAKAGRLTPEQIEFGQICAEYGIPCEVVSDLDSALGVLAGWGVVPSEAGLRTSLDKIANDSTIEPSEPPTHDCARNLAPELMK